MAEQLALSASRLTLVMPIMNLQEIRLEASGLTPPKCTERAQALAVARMDTAINMLTAFMSDNLNKQEQECALVELERLATEYGNEKKSIAMNGAFVPTPTPTRPGIGVSRQQFIDAFSYETDTPFDDLFRGCRTPRTKDTSEDWVFNYELIGQAQNLEYASIAYKFCGILTADEDFDEERVLAGYRTLLDLADQLPPSV